jgi:hypothetical protein
MNVVNVTLSGKRMLYHSQRGGLHLRSGIRTKAWFGGRGFPPCSVHPAARRHVGGSPLRRIAEQLSELLRHRSRGSKKTQWRDIERAKALADELED